jgi:hypothetical protein
LPALETHLLAAGIRADRRWVDCSLRLIVRQRYARRLEDALLADTAVLFAAASTRGLVSVVSVLSLYPVVVALARTVLAERIARA